MNYFVAALDLAEVAWISYKRKSRSVNCSENLHGLFNIPKGSIKSITDLSRYVPRQKEFLDIFEKLSDTNLRIDQDMLVFSSEGKYFWLELKLKYIGGEEDEIFATLKENGMRKDTHIRLTLSRGMKITSGMNPKLNQFGCTLIVLAEWKPPIYSGKELKLITANIRRNSPLCLDSKIHHNNLINNILAKIEANYAGVDDAIMLDLNGFVAETNATNIFMIKNGVVLTPFPKACLPGITRGLVIQLCRANNIPIMEKDISMPSIPLINSENPSAS